MPNRKILNQGFTLMELMIVMVIMSILAAIVMGSFGSSSRRGRDNRRKSDLKNLSTALETYFNDKGVYPTGVSGVMTGCGALDSQPCNWGGQFTDKNNTLYMVMIPSDPVSSQKYYYTSDGQSYMIYAKLENTLDQGSGVNQDGYDDQFGGGMTNCSTGTAAACTYGIASTNKAP